MRQRLLLTVLFLTVACPAAVADTFSVTLKVVDAQDKPVANARVGTHWDVQNGAMKTFSDKPIVTDATGKVPLTVDNWKEKRPVLVLSADRLSGAIVGVSKDDDGKELTVRLGPTVRVKGKLECKELGHKPEWANTVVHPDGFRAYFVQHVGTSAEFNFVLPAGKYKFHSYGTDVEDVRRTETITADRPDHDFGVIDMQASAIGRLKGKVPPEWVIADARGAPADVRLGGQKGKWVYIEFWGYW
jgi:hypothetical protein